MTRPVLIFMVVLTGCAQELPQQEILRPVRSQQVYATGGARVRSFSGMARAGRETDLSFRVSGRIEELNVEVGDAVRAGHLIARLEPRDFEIAQRQAEANLAQSQAQSRTQSVGGWNNRQFDYPALAVGEKYLYVTINTFAVPERFTRAVILRLPLDKLAAYQEFDIDYFDFLELHH